MPYTTDDVRIKELRPLIPPAILMEDIPLSEEDRRLVVDTRIKIAKILKKNDDRLLVVVGPCSIHDVDAALDYGRLLKEARQKYSGELEIIMRVYFEKPRTRGGWKGLINDPDLDGSFQINKGLRMARKLLVTLTEMGLPVAVEFLDTISPQFIADTISWGAIGARTTESQVHRELASGLSAPIGFKNGTNGNYNIAIDAIHAARASHSFLSVTKHSLAAIVSTKGNPHCHLILRGGVDGPNYYEKDISEAVKALEASGLEGSLMVDCSHGNSCKDHTKQPMVVDYLSDLVGRGEKNIIGLMIESHLKGGKQSINPDKNLMEYGKSITDACLSWDDTLPLFDRLAKAVKARRQGD
ncbi:3-deoxy-7-phosphoheptulonate synthase [Spirochaeta cellobiosiphila]|uniref:3-deoxy-7-phosphoheptulonate synthase n=1 Tax=Spirochaeta cellobiosiphila TaxID=504483 RepID=UPI000421C5B1|nr:3-deoxy-7-phosphoheptulonate synthase [Spirochaeta cellobiosiphila]